MNLISYNASFFLMNFLSCFFGQFVLSYFFRTIFNFWDLFFPLLFGNYIFVGYNTLSHHLNWTKLSPDLSMVLGAVCVWGICYFWYDYTLKSSSYVLGVHFVGNTLYNIVVYNLA